jgi:PAS domain S-box-containing protein
MKEMLERLRQTNALIELLQTANAELKLKSGLIVASIRGEIIYMSPVACEMFEHGLERVKGENIMILMPERYRAPHRAGLERVAEGEASRIVGRNLSLTGLTSKGREFPMMLNVELREVEEFGKILVARVHTHPNVDRSILLRVEAGVGANRPG